MFNASGFAGAVSMVFKDEESAADVGGVGVEEDFLELIVVEAVAGADKEKLATVGPGDADRETKTGGYRKSTFRKWNSLFD